MLAVDVSRGLQQPTVLASAAVRLHPLSQQHRGRDHELRMQTSPTTLQAPVLRSRRLEM
jgi:hypothetical protein